MFINRRAGQLPVLNLFPQFLFGLVTSMALYLGAWTTLDMTGDTFNMYFADSAGDTFDFVVGKELR